MDLRTLILVFEPIIIFLHFGSASETLCSDIPILSFNKENCFDKDAIQNVKLQNFGKNPGKALHGLTKFYLQEVGSLKEKRCLLISNVIKKSSKSEKTTKNYINHGQLQKQCPIWKHCFGV